MKSCYNIVILVNRGKLPDHITALNVVGMLLIM